MKKMFLTSAVLAIAGVGLVVGGAVAEPISFNFNGDYILTDSNGTNFLDRITFDNPDINYPGVTIITPGSGNITNFVPTDDALFGDIYYEYVQIADLYFDESDPYNFSPTLYEDGFQVFDDNGDQLFTADLTVVGLDIINTSVGVINSEFTFNLDDITIGSGYVAGTSVIVDSFLNADPGGATVLTLQFGGDIEAAINNVIGATEVRGTFSGSAAPVPEPATMLLFGTGLAGLAGVVRKKRKNS